MKFFKPYYHLYLGSLSVKQVQGNKNPEYARYLFKCLITDIKKKYSNTICIPKYICSVVPEIFMNAGIEVSFYDANNPYQVTTLDLLEVVGDGKKAVMIVNYFGLHQSEKEIYKYCNAKECLMVIDNSQMFYENNPNIVNNSVEVFSMRKFYYGGTGMASFCMEPTQIDVDTLSVAAESSRLDCIKTVFWKHTDINRLKSILMKRYESCANFFDKHLDDGYMMVHNTVPIGIPLKVNHTEIFSKLPYKSGCYIWPQYLEEDVSAHRVLVFPIHSMQNRNYVKRQLDQLERYGVIK
jgi:hypothetical protein